MGHARNNDERFDFVRSIPHWGLPLVAVVGVLVVPFHWWYLVVAAGLYLVRMFVLTAGYHRYFAHRSYKTSRAFQLFLAVAGTTCVQRGPIWWTAHHRNHHRYTDTPKDVHSPADRGLWWAHVGWLMCRGTDTVDLAGVRDLTSVPELRWVEKYWILFPVGLALALLGIGGLGLLVWGFFVSTTVLWHGTYTINSLAHRFGKVRYDTGDSSRNNWALALLTLGEGWHNNHHHYMGSARQGFFWWEVDITYYVLQVLQRVGLIWEMRGVPPRVRAAGLVTVEEERAQCAGVGTVRCAVGSFAPPVSSTCTSTQAPIESSSTPARRRSPRTRGRGGCLPPPSASLGATGR
jgi:stearoyl-CoA desaturase (delta-9 desaturase)